MANENDKYPIGVQSFEKLREKGSIYVDKTGYIAKLVKGINYGFLSRPRRFGKSLLISTLEAYFLGKKELFDGLEISKTEKEWTVYPVLHFDMSGAECTNPVKLEGYLINLIKKYENKYQVCPGDDAKSVGERFGWLIENIYHRLGIRVVILIDEYDKGIVDTIKDIEALKQNQDLLRPFFSQLKTKDAFIHFAFITGVSRFRHYTLFSGMNNPTDISFDARYAAICGITQEELIKYFPEGIENLSKKYKTTCEDIINKLIQKYDGFRFSDAEIYVFNPFCLLRAFDQLKLGDYWLMSGTPKVFVEYLADSNFDITRLSSEWFTEKRLSSLFDDNDPIPLLFQTGYLTIADFDLENNLYRLRIPNGEVRADFLEDLAPIYLGSKIQDTTKLSKEIRNCLYSCDLNGLIRIIDSIIAKVPYHIFNDKDKEHSYHLIMYMVCMLIGIDTRCEEPMADGRPDLKVITDKYIYIFEFKLDQSAQTALNQIEDRGYARPYGNDNRVVYRIGASFSSEKRNIQSWLIQSPNGKVTEIIP